MLRRLHGTRLPEFGFRSIYHDCSAIFSYEDFLTAVIRNWQPEVPIEAPATFGELLQSPPTDKPLVLLLDEVDKLVHSDGNSQPINWPLFSALRAFSNNGGAQFIFAGERMLREVLEDANSPLFNFANATLLGPLDFRAVEELIIRPMKQLEIQLEGQSAIVRCIWDFTGGHPNIVQRLCRRLITRLNEQSTRSITLDDVNAIIYNPQFQEEDFLQTYWERATPLEQIITLLMAQSTEPHRLRTILELLTRQGLQPEPEIVKAALDRLVDLRSILKRGQAGYEFAVEAFPHVLTNTTTIEDLLIVLKSQYLKNPMEITE